MNMIVNGPRRSALHVSCRLCNSQHAWVFLLITFINAWSLKRVFSSAGRKWKSQTKDMSAVDKKRVSFGNYLSPELFDKALPPVTPIKKGTAPKQCLSMGG